MKVFAAASLKELVTEITEGWSKTSRNTVQLQFDGSSTLARQIKEGAQADVFLSAAPEWVEEVRPRERFDWLSNRLVVVIRKDVTDFDLRKATSLALANEQVPAGKYAKAALGHEVIKLPERIIYGSNVRDVLSKVSQGGAQAGIVYATDATVDTDLQVAYVFPPESHPKILYTAGLLSEVGKVFFDALREPWATQIARRYGFSEIK